ncbi:hypothetical protein GCM10008983_07540 [Lentibacillus halophilus]|uniref:GGDEF domain-containing protein n=1 Tax=Lentibacillus halophilus TaxID=295065 RepID=A0ABN0Z4R1_9BACI
MGYKGRITGIAFVAIILFTIRTVVKSHFGAAPHPIPLPAIIPIIIGWYLGKEYDKSVYRANRDSLTGLFNRRYVFEKIHKTILKTKKRNNTLAIILLDINNFKQINDSFGHETGDLILKSISKLLANSFTSKDIVSRWGGDEFLIISSFADQNDLNQKIAHFENALKNQDWEYQSLSVSIGKAISSSGADEFESLISKADANMYEVKTKCQAHTQF